MMCRVAVVGATALLFFAGLPGGSHAQDLADYDYENLGFRGVGLEGGYLVFPTTVEEAYTVGARVDLGYLGPSVRIVPSLTYWSSSLKAAEVQELGDRLAELVAEQTGGPPPELDLGPIDWSDLVLGLDGHLVWNIPIGVLGFAGAGGSAHLMNGSGEAIDGNFIEDLLDSIRAGFNVHAGLEVPVHDRFRLYSQARYEMLGDLRYMEVRGGLQLFLGEPASREDER